MLYSSFLPVFVALHVLIRTVGAFTAPAYVDVGACLPFAIVAGSTVTNGGPSVVNGDLALTPGSAIAGFPPGKIDGTIHINDADASACMGDLVTAINDARGRAVDKYMSGELGGQTLSPGVYKSNGGYAVTNILYLDGENDPVAAWIFIMATTLKLNTGASVVMINYDNSKGTNVWWSCGSRADIYNMGAIQGTILAHQSIGAQNGASTGPLFANIGQVTLLSTVVHSYGKYTNDTTSIFTEFDDDSMHAAEKEGNSNKLGEGAIAGIIIGAVSCLLLLVVVLYFMCFCKTKEYAAPPAAATAADGAVESAV